MQCLLHRALQVQVQSLTALDTLSRCVSSCSALYCATVALTTSFPMDGSTRSSQSRPRLCAGKASDDHAMHKGT